ncbi:MAG: hypothetical protein WBK77_06135 [Alphaproteobacteria bacterium]
MAWDFDGAEKEDMAGSIALRKLFNIPARHKGPCIVISTKSGQSKVGDESVFYAPIKKWNKLVTEFWAGSFLDEEGHDTGTLTLVGALGDPEYADHTYHSPEECMSVINDIYEGFRR